ncbi:hypothetical protein BF49_7101 [Bradyrhizobium sp.]|nr:hypothetical protein BF49_3675 [Bradyrhizobium sp.]CUT16021.1 hypothetical protein BF49_7101 [Bradyrhizobium sp.]
MSRCSIMIIPVGEASRGPESAISSQKVSLYYARGFHQLLP